MTYSLNTLNADRAAAPPMGINRFAQEIGLLTGLVALVFAFISLVSYTRGDAAWSTTGSGAPLANWGGRAGAYLADGSFFLLGLSTWWLWLVGLRLWLAALAAWLREEPALKPDEWAGSRWAWLGSAPLKRLGFWLLLLLLVAASTVLEWSRLYRFESMLPGHSGGALGYWLGQMAMRWLGFNGSALVSIGVLVFASASVFRFSWGQWAEGLGRLLDGWWQARRERREADHDLLIGRQAARQRVEEEAAVAPWLASVDALSPAATAGGDTHTPVSAAPERTEPVLFDTAVQAAPVDAEAVQPPKPVARPEPVRIIEPVTNEPAMSDRVAKERQKPLFAEMPDSHLPQVDLLDGAPARQESVSADTLEMTSRLIEKKLKDFGVEVHVVAAAPGPVITRYEIEPATGVKGSQVVNLARDLARSLSLVSIRVIETIPGKNYMALELPNAKRQTIKLSEILGSQVYHEAKSLLTMGLGKDIVGNPVVADLAKMPHCLVAGTTGSGKSVGINAMILSLLYKADARDVRLMLIDPKMLEMSVYEGIPHLLCPVVTDMKQAANGLNWCVAEMEKRYKLLSKMGVRNLAGFNAKLDEAKARGEFIGNPFSLTPEQPEPLERLPHIVVVIDELADLMMVVGKKIEELIARLAQKARAAGIHLILATQRPSVDVITGLIKANIPTRISFQVSSKIDSRTILDQMGAEALLGMGDMLYMPSGTGYPIRVHGAFVSDDEVHRVVSYLKEQGGEPNYIDGVLEASLGDGEGAGADAGDGPDGEKDPMYDQAVEIVLKDRKASISYVQRKLKIGYNRSARLLEDMEKAGLVSSLTSSGQRDILVPARGGD
ncbi:MAG TPA: DNA translocase FtsK 4TM domain-containing protein [Burkholderiaceae bacterium]|nr:DNA translocase FtsK 4TM domain-containing protein [Burkholderiaceae bacterium]